MIGCDMLQIEKIKMKPSLSLAGELSPKEKVGTDRIRAKAEV